MAKKHKNHPWFYELLDSMQQGKLSRREFIRYATLLGVSATAAYQTAGLFTPSRAHAAEIKRGGTLRIAASVMKIQHPSQTSWGQQTNQLQQMLEFLVVTDANNMAHPHLLENWEVSEDLKTWTLNLRRGITFNNGDEFVADDVAFAFNQWLDKGIGSTMRTLFNPILSEGGVEKVNQYQVKLHLRKPDIGVPYYLNENRALIMNHRTFEGDIIKAPHGTGPYLLESYAAAERITFKRRPDYWQNGADGQPLPYLDAQEFIDMGTDNAPKMAAIQSGEIDAIDLSDVGGVEFYEALRDKPGVQLLPSPSGYANILRMRADVEPWSDNRVRMALKHCQFREKILKLAYFDQGLQGHDTHIYPKAAAYCEKSIPRYDTEKAQALLKEAGYPDGIDVTINIPADVKEIVRFAEILKQDAAPAGFRIKIEVMPSSRYWEKWTEFDLGITAWAHRDLDTQVFNQAYTVDEDGKPVPWNETRWVDEEFIQLLHQANGTLDVDERRKIMCALEEIQMTRGTVGISYFANGWYVLRDHVKGFETHPRRTWVQYDAWLDQRT